MNKIRLSLPILLALVFTPSGISLTVKEYSLPEPVKVELNRLDEAYTILDQFSEKVWTGWNDYLKFPFLMTFQDGFRVLVGHPAPPAGFTAYPQKTIHGLSVFIDTSNLNGFKVQLPLRCGGGLIPYGNVNNKAVTVVSINLLNAVDGHSTSVNYLTAEDHILVYIHELMHCYQEKILTHTYGNLNLNPDLNYALYSEIEGLALIRAFEKNSCEESLPFLKDFCVARSLKFKGMSKDEMNQARCDEFREGEAVYSEVTILQCLKRGYKSNLTPGQDPGYTRFENINHYLDKYLNRLMESAGKTLELYEKNYDYGCFESLLLQRCFPGWQKFIESGSWLDLVLREKLGVTASDSLESLKRFTDLYLIDDVKKKHEKIIQGRNDTYRMLSDRKGQTYVISFKPIHHFIAEVVDKARQVYKLGLIEMYPDGLGTLEFDSIFLKMNAIPTEINQLYYVKVIDIQPSKTEKKYSVQYESKDDKGIYYNATITTPLFTLKAPKLEIRQRSNRIKCIVLSRT